MREVSSSIHLQVTMTADTSLERFATTGGTIMGTPMRWLAALATGGAVAGGAAALTQTPTADAKTVSSSATVAASPPKTPEEAPGTTLDVGPLLDEANQLQSAIAAARSSLAHMVGATHIVDVPIGPATTAGPPTTTASAEASLLAQRQQLAADEAAVAAERQQLATEAQQLTGQAQQISAEQAQLQKEAAALAAAQAQQAATPPPTHTTTGATTGSGSHDD